MFTFIISYAVVTVREVDISYVVIAICMKHAAICDPPTDHVTDCVGIVTKEILLSLQTRMMSKLRKGNS